MRSLLPKLGEIDMNCKPSQIPNAASAWCSKSGFADIRWNAGTISICLFVTDIFCSQQTISFFRGIDRDFACRILAVRLVAIFITMVLANQLHEKFIDIAGSTRKLLVSAKVNGVEIISHSLGFFLNPSQTFEAGP